MFIKERQRKGAVGVREAGRARVDQKFEKNLTMPKIVAKCRKPTHSTQHYLNTLPKTYPILIHRGEEPSRFRKSLTVPKTQCQKYPIPFLIHGAELCPIIKH